MPIYEYRCKACGATRELILKPGEQARPACPRCRRRMERMISPTAFILKGSGWYVTDYPSRERKKGMEAEKGGGHREDKAATPEKTGAAAKKNAGEKKKPSPPQKSGA